MSAQVQIIFSAGRQFYAVPDVKRECMLWLSAAKHPLPVPSEWRRPGHVAACVIRGRHYYRVGIFGPQREGSSEAAAADDERVRDYCDAAWWTPGLEEAWVELQGMKEVFAETARLHLCEQNQQAEQRRKNRG